jgi:hypothetical protein
MVVPSSPDEVKLGTHVVDIKNDAKLTVYVSTVVHSIAQMDAAEKTYQATLGLCFRYDVGDYLRILGNHVADHKYELKSPEIFPEDIKMTWDMPNVVSREFTHESHWFRKCTKPSEKDECPVPIYGDNTDVIPLIQPPYDKIPSGSIWKCESFGLHVTCNFSNHARHTPFEHSYLFLKFIVGDGRPGAEKMVWKFDERESSMQGMLTPVGAFTPLDTRPHVNNVNIVVGTTKDVVWPRLYMSMRYHRHVRESILKYYLIPLMLFSMLVVAPLGDDVGELMATGSTLVLACIALIFTSDRNGLISFQELNVILQSMMIMAASVVLAYKDSFGFDEGSVGLLNLELMAADLLVAGAIFAIQYWSASVKNRKILNAIQNNEFTIIDAL